MPQDSILSCYNTPFYRPVGKPLNEIFRFPWDTLIDGKGVQPTPDYPYSPHKDPLLEKLADILN